jgi:hypothetical protein
MTSRGTSSLESPRGTAPVCTRPRSARARRHLSFAA